MVLPVGHNRVSLVVTVHHLRVLVVVVLVRLVQTLAVRLVLVALGFLLQSLGVRLLAVVVVVVVVSLPAAQEALVEVEAVQHQEQSIRVVEVAVGSPPLMGLLVAQVL